MLINLKLENFKIHAQADIPLAPVTLLAGLNSSGKSTVIQALLLLQENLKNSASHDVFLNGDWIELGRPSDVYCDNALSDVISIRAVGDGITHELSGVVAKGRPIRVTQLKNEPYRENFIKQYLCAERVGPRNSYPMNEIDPKIATGFLGIRGEYTFQYLAGIVDGQALPNVELRHSSAESNGLFHNIEKWMGELSPGVRLESRDNPQGAIVVPSFYYSAGLNRRPGHVGFGLTYSLPIITAILSAKPGDLLLIENPEAHLNPQGQIAIAKLIAKASEHVQIIIESHSDHILNGLCYSVAVDGTPTTQMVFNYFSRGPDGVKMVSIQPKKNGRLESWPEGFFDQYQDTITKIMRASSINNAN